MTQTFMNTKQAAKRVKYKDASVIRHAILNGWLHATKIGRDWMLTEDDLNQWIAEGRRVYPKRENLNEDKAENP